MYNVSRYLFYNILFLYYFEYNYIVLFYKCMYDVSHFVFMVFLYKFQGLKIIYKSMKYDSSQFLFLYFLLIDICIFFFYIKMQLKIFV